MRIGERHVGPYTPPYVIAEIGVNHDGSVERALQLAEAAAAAGADAIKLQCFQTDRLLSKAATLAAYQRQGGAHDPFAMLRSLELSVDQMKPIVDRAHAMKLHAIVTVFTVELVGPCGELPWEAYKTASPDIINKPLIDALMQTGKPLLLSCGAATTEEIARASEWVGDHPHAIMHCVSAYPTPDDQAHLAGRCALRCLDASSLGYSDHTTSIDTGGLAVANGARLLEKHLTYDRTARGPDHAASLEPGAFADYVRYAHRAFAMLGAPSKHVQSIEHDVRTVARQSLTSTSTLPAGHRLSSSDMTIKRPGTGLPPWMWDEALGRRLTREVAADFPITLEDLE